MTIEEHQALVMKLLTGLRDSGFDIEKLSSSSAFPQIIKSFVAYREVGVKIRLELDAMDISGPPMAVIKTKQSTGSYKLLLTKQLRDLRGVTELLRCINTTDVLPAARKFADNTFINSGNGWVDSISRVASAKALQLVTISPDGLATAKHLENPANQCWFAVICVTPTNGKLDILTDGNSYYLTKFTPSMRDGKIQVKAQLKFPQPTLELSRFDQEIIGAAISEWTQKL